MACVLPSSISSATSATLRCTAQNDIVATMMHFNKSQLPITTKLPLEVLYDIIDWLALPPTAHAYMYDADVIQSLCSLCRVNRSVRPRATFHLYACVALLSRRQVTRILRSGIRHCALIRSLRICLDGYTQETGRDIGRIFACVAPTLERLMVDGEPRATLTGSDPVGTAIAHLPKLREFALVRYNGCLSGLEAHPTPIWTGLRRLVLQGFWMFGDVSSLGSLLLHCPNVEVLAIAWHIFLDNRPRLVDFVIDMLPSLRELILIYPDAELDATQSWIVLREQAIAIRHAARLSILEVAASEVPHMCIPTWTAMHVEAGSLWTLPGRNWLVPDVALDARRKAPCVYAT